MPKKLRWLRSPSGSDAKPWKNWRLSRSRIRCWPGTENSSPTSSTDRSFANESVDRELMRKQKAEASPFGVCFLLSHHFYSYNFVPQVVCHAVNCFEQMRVGREASQSFQLGNVWHPAAHVLVARAICL
jgi:hypothetical protein